MHSMQNDINDFTLKYFIGWIRVHSIFMNACRDSGEGMLMCHKDTEVNVQMNRPEFPNSPLWLGSVQE